MFILNAFSLNMIVGDADIEIRVVSRTTMSALPTIMFNEKAFKMNIQNYS